VAAAVSGGADSVALLLLLHELAEQGALVLTGLAHLHHHIRGADADADLTFVEDLARRLGLRAEVGHADVPALARGAGRSVEVAAREARLAFFDAAAASLDADVVALAHSRTDQAETVLMRLVRGAGPRGLAAMAPRTGRRVRPLLDVGRDELRAWLIARRQPWREDRTNVDTATPRNRLRLDVLPRLVAINPRVEDALVRAARIHAEDAGFLDDVSASAFARVVEPLERGLRVDTVELASLPDAVARRVVWRLLETLDPRRAPGWQGTQAVLDALRSGGCARLGGRLQMERIGAGVVLRIRGRAGVPLPACMPDQTLHVPGTARDARNRWVLDARGPMSLEEAGALDGIQVALDAEALGRHLTIRGWRDGDRMQPLGLAGHKKLQDLFVDRKVPRDERRLVPVVLDARGRIAWVPGLAVGEAFRVTPCSTAVVVLNLRR
jgi:tRNA(Ile)-lysidine synthase